MLQLLTSAVFLLLFLRSTSSSVFPPCPTLRPHPKAQIIFYNVLHGGEDRLSNITAYIKSHSALDFLALAELNHWGKDKLQRFGEELGMPHTYFLYTKHGYHLGIVSRHSFDILSKVTQQGLWHHGHIYVHVPRLDISILVTHLSPHKSTVRRWECTQILKTWDKQLPLLVLGDLNTLSPLDAPTHDSLPDLFVNDTRLSQKFLNERSNIDYLPMEILLSGPLFDAGLVTGAMQSVPTGLTQDFMHAAPMRLDYALASQQNAFVAGVDSNEVTWLLSDHLPLLVQMCGVHVAGEDEL